MNSPVKRGKIYAHLKSLKADICFLQETHIKKTAARILRLQWATQIYQSNFSVKARGVAILIHKRTMFQHEQTITDQNGRYLIVRGLLNQMPVTLINVYGPNFDDPGFFQTLFRAIPNLSDSKVVMAGDFNSVVDPLVDRQRPQLQKSKSSTTLNSLMKGYNLVDIWRLLNPSKKDFSFFSSVHKTYSRIDFFLLDFNLISSVSGSSYHNIVISDHSPVSLDLQLNHEEVKYSWRLNNSLLKDKKFCKYITEKISFYLNTNDRGDVNDSTLWETLKAVIRGDIISYETSERKRTKKRLADIQERLTELENSYKVSNTNTELLNEIVALRYEYNDLLSKDVIKLLTHMKQKHFELGEKPHNLLSRQLKQMQSSRAIYQIKSSSGHTLTHPKMINDRFREFYSEVYKSQGNIDKEKMKAFFARIQLPQLSEEAIEVLDADLTLTELNSAISSFATNKAPGPDGFSMDFFKKFKPDLTPLLMRMFNHSKETAVLPPTLYNASIAVIPKPGRDPLLASSYRPISLLPAETKILGKILADRLKKFICNIVHSDQTGFMPGRQLHFNLRRLFNIMYSKHTTEAAIISLDAQRAFDQMGWPYMQEALEQFGFGTAFRQWIEIIYAQPSASVITNQTASIPFPIHRGTRQGCPLSPFLFAILIEPLAISIRHDANIAPIVVNGTKHHLSLYADDMLLYVSMPQMSIPPLLQLIEGFGSFSGFTINLDKSELMPISDKYNEEFFESIPLKKAYTSFIYLGITVTKNPNDLMKTNWQKRIDKLKQNIDFWKSLPISLVGRVNAIKMVVLPQFLFFFQGIPFYIPQSYFKQLDSIITPFIWSYKTVRIAKKHLCKPKREGGFGLPFFKLYHWAATLSTIAWWKSGPQDSTEGCPAWLTLERALCNGTSLLALLNSPTKCNKTLFTGSSIIADTLKIWSHIKRYIKAPSTYLDSPICNNHAFAPGKTDAVFATWLEKGISDLNSLYIDGIFASFAQLQSLYNIPASNLFRYFQIREFTKKHIPSFHIKPCHETLNMINRFNPLDKGAVSYFYHSLLEMTPKDSSAHRQAWATELNEEIGEVFWEQCLENINDCSVNVRHNLIQFKTLHRLYYCKTKIHKFDPSTSPLCNRCKITDGTLAHTLWSCIKLSSYWYDIFQCFSKAFKKTFKPDPLVAILGGTGALLLANTFEAQAVSLGMVVAKKMILQMWKSDFAPSYEMWLREMGNVLSLEKIRYHNMDKMKYYHKIWDPLLSYIRGED